LHPGKETITSVFLLHTITVLAWSPYFSACGMTFVLLIVGALVPGILSAMVAHPMAANQ